MKKYDKVFIPKFSINAPNGLTIYSEHGTEYHFEEQTNVIVLTENELKEVFDAGYDYRSSLLSEIIEEFGYNSKPDIKEFLKQKGLL